MAAILQTTVWNAFSWMKINKFLFKFHWISFLRVQLTIFQHSFRWWLGTDQATSHYLNKWGLHYRRIYASLGLMTQKWWSTGRAEYPNLNNSFGNCFHCLTLSFSFQVCGVLPLQTMQYVSMRLLLFGIINYHKKNFTYQIYFCQNKSIFPFLLSLIKIELIQAVEICSCEMHPS